MRHRELSSLCLCFSYRSRCRELLENEAETNTNPTRGLIARIFPIKATDRIPASIRSRAGRTVDAEIGATREAGNLCPDLSIQYLVQDIRQRLGAGAVRCVNVISGDGIAHSVLASGKAGYGILVENVKGINIECRSKPPVTAKLIAMAQ